MMKTLKITGLAILLAALPSLAQAGESPPMPMPGGGGMPHMGGGMHMPRTGMPNMGGGMNMPHPGMPNAGGPRNWGPRHNGRWTGGMRAPGGWGGYRRPFTGYTLPSYWINPGFYLGNYYTYGLSRPAYGYGWSRYYDDAVLTDRYGRVYDSAYDVDWDRYDRYDDGLGRSDDYSDSYGYRDDGYANDGRGYRTRGGGSGIGGAIAGGAIGAIAGSAIAGRGERTAGALIGGGLGAIAGAAVDSSSSRYGRGYKANRVKRTRRGQMPYDYGYNNGRDDVTTNGQWQGAWTGSWNGGPTQTWQGTYEGSQPHWGGNGDGGQVTYPEPRPDAGRPVVVHQGTAPYPYGYNYTNGYGGETTTITIQQQPVTTTTTTTTEEIYYASAPRKRYAPRRVWKPRPRRVVRCVCGS